MTKTKAKLKTDHRPLEGPAIMEGKYTPTSQPHPPPPLFPVVDPFGTDAQFLARAGAPPQDSHLKRLYLALAETLATIRKDSRVILANERLAEGDRLVRAAEIADTRLQATLRHTDNGLAKAAERIVGLNHKLNSHLKPAQTTSETLRFQWLLDRLEGRSDRFSLGHAAARSGDGETVRAMLNAPEWLLNDSNNALAAIRAAYLKQIATEELAELEQIEAGVERVAATGELLTKVIFEAVDFQKAALAEKAGELADAAAKAAHQALQDARELE